MITDMFSQYNLVGVDKLHIDLAEMRVGWRCKLRSKPRGEFRYESNALRDRHLFSPQV